MISVNTIEKFNSLYKEVIKYYNEEDKILFSSFYSTRLNRSIAILGLDYVKLNLLDKEYKESLQTAYSDSLFRTNMNIHIKKIEENRYGYYNKIIPFFITHMSIYYEHLEFLTKQTFINMNYILLEIREEPPF
jgi:hypothetical protein